MFGDDELGFAAYVVAVGVGVGVEVILGAVDEAHDVGILLDGARLTQVAELGAFAVGAVFDAAIELRQGDDGDVELFGQLLERARNHGHFLLSRTELHAAGVHELEVVDDNHLDVVLTGEAHGFGAQFEDGERGGVVDVEGSAVQGLDARHELVPLQGRKLAAFDFGAFEFADVGDEAVDELYIAHLEREERDGCVVGDGHILSHGEDEGGLTHGGTDGDDDEVGILPAAGDFVEFVVAGLEAREAAGAIGGVLYLFEGL